MNIFEIKEEHKTTIVGFNGSGLPLGKRNDLDKLAEMAHVNKSLGQYFVNLPTTEQIAAYRAGSIVEAIEEQTAEAGGSTQPFDKLTVTPEEQPSEEAVEPSVRQAQDDTEEATPTTDKKRGKKANSESK